MLTSNSEVKCCNQAWVLKNPVIRPTLLERVWVLLNSWFSFLGGDSHDRPYGHVFIVGIQGPFFLRVQMVPRTKSAERSQRSDHLDHLKTTARHCAHCPAQ